MFSSIAPPSNGMSFWLHDHERKKTVDCSFAFKRRERRQLRNEPLFRNAGSNPDAAGTWQRSRPLRAAGGEQHPSSAALELGLARRSTKELRPTRSASQFNEAL